MTTKEFLISCYPKAFKQKVLPPEEFYDETIATYQSFEYDVETKKAIPFNKKFPSYEEILIEFSTLFLTEMETNIEFSDKFHIYNRIFRLTIDDYIQKFNVINFDNNDDQTKSFIDVWKYNSQIFKILRDFIIWAVFKDRFEELKLLNISVSHKTILSPPSLVIEFELI
jgi:hypothetical protein